MKNLRKISLLIGISFLLFACPKKNDDPQPIPPTISNVNTIKTDTVGWGFNKLYIFNNDTALAFIAKWNNKTIKCINVDPTYSQDTITITLTKIMANGKVDFQAENGFYVLRIIATYPVYGDTIQYMVFNKNRFIRELSTFDTSVNPWMVVPKTSVGDFVIMDSNTINFYTGYLVISPKGMRITN